MNKNEMIEAIRSIAAKHKITSVPRHLFLMETGLSERQVYKIFGSYNALVESAGLKPMIFPTSESPLYDDQELLAEIVRVLRLPNSKLSRISFEQNALMSSSVCERRFGGWLSALNKATELLDPNTEADIIFRVREYIAPNLSIKPPSLPKSRVHSTQTQDSSIHADEEIEPTAIPFQRTNLYGDFINFRGLQHAPVNEQGVVFLFGMICRELGYVVESVRSNFPDCEAKRKIQGSKGKWQRVRIEFEFESRSFKSHGHNPDQCDVIVCWEHNWPECPIEVLELSSALMRLGDAVA
jgi:hypothetical protein